MSGFLSKIGTAVGTSLTATITTTGTATVGNTIIIAVRSTKTGTPSTFNTGSSVLTPVTDSAGNTYHKDKATLLCVMFRAHVTTKLPAGGTIHMKQEFSGATHHFAIVVGVWSGLLVTPVDGSRTAHSATPNTSFNFATTTATVASDIWVMCVALPGSALLVTPSTGFTIRAHKTSTTSQIFLADFAPGTTGPHSYGWTWVSTKSYSGCMVLYKVGAVTFTGTSSLAGSGVVAATGTRSTTGSGSYVGSGTLSATGLTSISGAGAYTGSGVLSASGIRSTTGSSAVSGIGLLSATGTRSTTGSSNFVGSAILTATGIRSTTGSSILSGIGLLSATGIIVVPGNLATLSSLGILSATGVVSRSGSSSISGVGILSATGIATAPTGGHGGHHHRIRLGQNRIVTTTNTRPLG